MKDYIVYLNFLGRAHLVVSGVTGFTVEDGVLGFYVYVPRDERENSKESRKYVKWFSLASVITWEEQ